MSAIWVNRTRWTPWLQQLPAMVVERAEWERTHLPKLRAYDAAQAEKRAAEAAHRVEADAALEWCRANGNPHKFKDQL
jgi:hypothetical protein